MMAGIRSRDTKPEIVVRKALFAAGFRARLHRSDLPGTPDVALLGRKIAIFVHGCFWHAHPDCRYAKIPATRREFWEVKLAANVERDRLAREKLLSSGWRVLVVWECATRSRPVCQELPKLLARWIAGTELAGEIGSCSKLP